MRIRKLTTAAVLIPAVVFAADPAPKIESITSAADDKSVDVTFTVAPFTTRSADGTSASGAVAASDFTVTNEAGSHWGGRHRNARHGSDCLGPAVPRHRRVAADAARR